MAMWCRIATRSSTSIAGTTYTKSQAEAAADLDETRHGQRVRRLLHEHDQDDYDYVAYVDAVKQGLLTEKDHRCRR